MSRKGQARVREVTPDPKFHDRTLAKFVNVVMVQGKKSLAEQILYRALDTIAERSKEDGLVVFKRALDGDGGARARREIDGRAAGGRDSGSGRQSRRRGQEARGYPSDGRSQQG